MCSFFCLVGDIDGLLVGKNGGFDITRLPHVGEIEIVRDQIPTSAPPTPYWGAGLGIDSCIMTVVCSVMLWYHAANHSHKLGLLFLQK